MGSEASRDVDQFGIPFGHLALGSPMKHNVSHANKTMRLENLSYHVQSGSHAKR